MKLVMEPLLAELDIKLVYILAGILLVLAVLAIIKKVVKLGIIILIVALAVTTLGPKAKQIQENLNIKVADGVVSVTLDGMEYNLDREVIKEIRMESGLSIGKYKVTTTLNNGADGVSFDLPLFMGDTVKQFAVKNRIKLEVID